MRRVLETKTSPFAECGVISFFTAYSRDLRGRFASKVPGLGYKVTRLPFAPAIRPAVFFWFFLS